MLKKNKFFVYNQRNIAKKFVLGYYHSATGKEPAISASFFSFFTVDFGAVNLLCYR